MFNKMIVAIDGSDMSAKALEAAVHLAKEQQAELSILHVGREAVVTTSSLTGIVYVPEHFIEEIRGEVKKEGLNILEKAKEQAAENGIQAETIYAQGEPAHEILNTAKEKSASLIVVGSRGISGLKEMMLGSVSHKVSQLSTCPVLIVR
ncbi:universal stress protein [Bacillus vallismortis]|uniref:universal stress protein n=1 Tax=Bacillus vallismortis TaxID=72361 RepID=UPI00227F5E0C|nr:universal stress protein [Bacillus vallismortis]MCY7917273.1 universal stress protein [Bacillus vallismortis]